MKSIKKMLLSSTLFSSVLLTSCDPLFSIPSLKETGEESLSSTNTEVSDSHTSASVDDSLVSVTTESISSEVVSSEIILPPEAARLVANSEAWGLGTTVTKYVTNDREYEWYVDQYNTGEFWYENCGPTSVEMAGRYYDPNFSHTAAEARSLYRPEGGWWFDTDISASLTTFGVLYTTITIYHTTVLTKALNNGNVVLVNPTMELVNSEEDPAHRTGLYYLPGTGHYLIVKGYVVVDGQTFFEVYDPWSVDERYDDGTLKGKDRYYDAKSFLNAIMKWYTKGYAINKLDESSSEV